MSYKQPDTYFLSSPYGIDKVIQSLQSDLLELSWLDVSLGRALIFIEGSNKFPKVLQSDKEYYNCLPNDNFVSQSFIQLKGIEKYSEDIRVNSNFKTRDLSITFWCNIKQLNVTVEQLKQEVEVILRNNNYIATINGFLDEPTEKVFEGFTINDKTTQYGMYPYAAFRFDLTITYSDTTC